MHPWLRFPAYAIMAVLLLYSSGLNAAVALISYHVGAPIPLRRVIWRACFPLNFDAAPADGALYGYDFVSAALPYFGLSLLWEAVVLNGVVPRLPEKLRPAAARPVDLSDALTSLSLGVLSLVVAVVVALQWMRPLYDLTASRCRVCDLERRVGRAGAFWLAFLQYDLQYYWWHRASHKISWLWVDHVVHHSSEEYNLSTALRQPFVTLLTPNYVIASLPLALFVDYEVAAAVATLSLLYQYWIHAAIVPPMKRFQLLFNAPALHRAHHARDQHCLGCNFGAVLSVWDRAFGTLVEDGSLEANSKKQPLRYGTVPVLRTWSVVEANLAHLKYVVGTQVSYHGATAPFRKWTPPNGAYPKFGHRLNPADRFEGARLSRHVFYAAAQWLVAAPASALALRVGPRALGAAVAPPAWPAAIATNVAGVFVFLLALASFEGVAKALAATTRAGRVALLRHEAPRHVVVAAALAAAAPRVGWPPRVAWPVAGAYAALHALWLAHVARAPTRDPSVDYLPLAAPPIDDARRRASTSVDF